MLISVTLRITGNQLDPHEITAILGVEPHVSRRRGDARLLPSGKELVAKFGVWEWRSKDSSESLSVADHIARIRAALGDRCRLLRNLPNAENAWIDIHVVDGDTESEASSVQLLLDPAVLSTIHDMGLPVEITVDIMPPTAASVGGTSAAQSGSI